MRLTNQKFIIFYYVHFRRLRNNYYHNENQQIKTICWCDVAYAAHVGGTVQANYNQEDCRSC